MTSSFKDKCSWLYYTIFLSSASATQLCPYEASSKFYYLRTHCALALFYLLCNNNFIKSLFTCRLLKRCSCPFALKIKHSYSYIHNDSNHICVRIFIGSRIRLLKESLSMPRFGNQPKCATYSLLDRNAWHYINRTDQWNYTPIIPLIGILVLYFLRKWKICFSCKYM